MITDRSAARRREMDNSAGSCAPAAPDAFAPLLPVSRPSCEKTLLLVDGSSYLYRAFHALPDLKSPRGEPTGAIYGVVNMLRRLAADCPAQARACVFDAPGPTFRDTLYPEYKATRPPMPPELAAQVEPLHELVAELGWPVLCVPGVEADDVIATLAEEAKRRGWSVVVSSQDKDLAQLVDEHLIVVNTMSGERLDEKGVVARFGLPPARIPDWLALVGDAVDNLPGVDKVGPKTATRWLREYGTLEGVIANATRIGGAAGENLRRALEWLPKARALATVRRDVALPVTLEALAQASGRIGPRLRELLERFGFRSWLRELEGARAGAPAPTGGGRRRYATLLDETALEDVIAKLQAAPLAGFDTETTGLEPMRARLVGLSFACGEEAWYLPLAHDYAGAPAQLPLARALERLRPWLESERHAKVGQNLKFDAHVLANHGVRLRGIAHDTLLESYVLEAHERHDLDSLAERHLGWRTIRYDEVTGKGAARIPFAAVPLERATAYAAEDADCALALHEAMHPRIAGDAKLTFIYERIEMSLVPVLFAMERHGVRVDAPQLAAQSRELAEQMLDIEQRAYAAAGCAFNLNSPRQVQEILFERMGLPVKRRTASGQPSTDEEALEELALDHPLPKLLLEYRALAKLRSTYTEKLPRMIDPETGRVHTTYSQTTAVTGRLASNDPNLQNIPARTPQGRRIRAAFVAPPGWVLVSADYSQIELRIMAHLSGDSRLLAAILAGEDVHRATASEIFGLPVAGVSAEQRRAAKAINFGLIYGMSAFGLARQLGIERGAAQSYIERYFARYPGVARYMEQTRQQAREQGYVETLFGRRLRLPEIHANSASRRQAAERAAINAPLQGTAADIVKKAMIAVQRWLEEHGLASRMILQVHDELVLEVPDDEVEQVRAALPELMSGVAQLAVPLLVEIGVGRNWESAH